MLPENLYGPNASILITGASSGIGAAMAEHLAQYGGRIALLARREDRLQQVAEGVRASGASAMVLPCDVTDLQAVRAAHEQLVQQQGPVSVAVLNAGIGQTVNIDRFEAAVFKRVFDVNVMGVVNCIEVVLPSMLEQRRGTIIGISSLAATRGVPGNGPYCASKAALSRLLESLRIEAKPRGVQVSIVEPGFVRSELTDRNEFPMPFLLDTEPAVRLICDAVAEGQGRIRFPWPFATMVRLLGSLPDALYERVGAAVAHKVKKRPA